MQLYPKPKTDAEYVELIRKHVGRSKWLALFLGCLSVGFLLAYWLLWQKVYGSGDSTINKLNETIESGVRIGIMLGATEGLLLIFAASHAVFAVQYLLGDRTKRLMLKFYDELKKQNK